MSRDYNGTIERTDFICFKKTHPDAVLPSSKNPTDTGLDISSVEDTLIPAKSANIVPTGLTVAHISPNIWYSVLPRSGLGFKNGVQPHLGVIDSEYRGDLAIKLYNLSDKDYLVKKGDRIAQLAFYPLIKPTVNWMETVIDTTRGSNGFGSSGL